MEAISFLPLGLSKMMIKSELPGPPWVQQPHAYPISLLLGEVTLVLRVTRQGKGSLGGGEEGWAQAWGRDRSTRAIEGCRTPGRPQGVGVFGTDTPTRQVQMTQFQILSPTGNDVPIPKAMKTLVTELERE